MGDAAKMIVTMTVDDLRQVFSDELRRAIAADATAAPNVEMLTTKQAAKLLNTSPRNVRYLVAQGLRAQRVGKDYRFARADLLAWGRSTQEK